MDLEKKKGRLFYSTQERNICILVVFTIKSLYFLLTFSRLKKYKKELQKYLSKAYHNEILLSTDP
jgi:hypothetical protein